MLDFRFHLTYGPGPLASTETSDILLGEWIPRPYVTSARTGAWVRGSLTEDSSACRPAQSHEGTSRDAAHGLYGAEHYHWPDKPELIHPSDPRIDRNPNSGGQLYAASKRDVKKYMRMYKSGSKF